MAETASLLGFCGALLSAAIALGILVFSQRSGTRWLLAAGMASLSLESLFSAFASGALMAPEAAYWHNWSLLAMGLLPCTWLAFSLRYARGEHRNASSGWQVGLIVAFLFPAGLAVVSRGEFVEAVGEKASDGLWLILLRGYGVFLHLCLLLSCVLVLMNLERTFRASVGTMRWRIKFMILGLGVLFAVRLYTSTQVLLLHTATVPLEELNSGALLVACLLMLRSLFRAGHFEVNVYPSQSLLHSSLTVLLAGIYLVVVGVLAKVVALLGGAASLPLKSLLVLVSLVLLSVVLLSDRVRLYTRRFVSRHFQRPIYDYRKVWRTFTEGTARCVEEGQLCTAVSKMVSDIFQSLSVTIWLIGERKGKLRCAASTALFEGTVAEATIAPEDAAQIAGAFEAHSEPVDLERSKADWAAVLRRLHPGEFPKKGGHHICVPLLAGGELIGLMVLCDRVGGVPYSDQDLDVLRSVGEQAAASLLNLQLSERLAQARQLEAFQAMSAFFVHDLKNTASTLSLMLQNLPVHFSDPNFREDALRGISKTVNHLNDLIGRLNLLRQELELMPVECDLNDLVDDTLKGQDQTAGVELVKELGPIPKVRLDPGQIQKVLTNLVLNARDAVGPGGRIRVETTRRNGWVVLAVADNGCGMSNDFIQRCLFRPFQTTKKKGIGIGMFHCKMIVEAHRGKIEVESEPGKGTAFRVLLPATA
jgi:putative PEP-CTERM system histidine kinase